jgi:hypothetical protein
VINPGDLIIALRTQKEEVILGEGMQLLHHPIVLPLSLHSQILQCIQRARERLKAQMDPDGTEHWYSFICLHQNFQVFCWEQHVFIDDL